MESTQESTPPTPEEDKKHYQTMLRDVVAERNHPVLVMFYPPFIAVREEQIEALHNALRDAGLCRETPLEHIDVLLHTTGGDPITAYRMAQIIRDFAEHVTFLIPEFAYSAGTLLCLSADDIVLGDHAVLSPMDITLVTERSIDASGEDDLFPDEDPSGEVETVAIDYFIQVAKQARIEIEAAFRKRRWKNSETNVECALLTEMTKQLGVLAIAKYYREKNTTREYAKELLKYMFGDSRLAHKHIEHIIRQLVTEAPSHEFPMDYHICASMGLRVSEMPERLSDASRSITTTLAKLARAREICRPTARGLRLPVFDILLNDEEPTPPTPTDTVDIKEEANEQKNGTSAKVRRQEPALTTNDNQV